MDNSELLWRGVSEVIVKENLEKKLKEGKKLRVKLGIDPTAPELHLGHAVVLRKLKQFQDAGHEIVLIIGDFTAQIGDPSGRDTTRQALTPQVVNHHSETYLKQVFKILDEKKTEIHRQSEWFSNFDLRKTIQLQSKVTLEQLLEHETFKRRLQKNLPLSIHELIYPLLQGYDSVAIKSDLELGGVDQKFNLLMGREIQKVYGQKSQDILTLKYLIGTDGKEKMSKSLKNYIALNDPPSEMYGKVMSISDSLIPQYFELLTDVEDKALEVIEKELKNKTRNPRDVKAKLAKLIVETYYDAAAAEEAEAEFEKVFQKGEIPSEMPEIKMKEESLSVVDLLLKTNLASSKSEARRLIGQGGLKIAGKQIKNFDQKIDIRNGQIVQVGPRRFVKIVT